MSSKLGQQSSASSTSLLIGRDDAESSRINDFKYSLAPSPKSWGTPIDIHSVEPDDYLHNPDPLRDRNIDKGGHICTARGIANLGCLFLLGAGFPLLTHFLEKKQTTQGGFNLGGINATGQVPDFTGNYGLVDRETPLEAHTKKSYNSDEELVLVFSDEFNVDGRSFYPGDDPFWEAVDLHYWGTNDLEWYDPNQPTTQGGSLRLTLEKVEPENNHDLSYRSGMVQSWNKFCFTGGLIEVSVTLPGSNKVSGLWPAVWAMGNLGRAGYGSSLDGMWPYSYDSCDVGTLPNQTHPGTSTPLATIQNGDPSKENMLSYLPGQRLSSCTCPGESHPGPMRADGTYVGRAAPEIDVFEAIVDGDGGKVSLSAQWAPYNAGYNWINTTDNLIIHDTASTVLNQYKGGVYQQTTSGLAATNQDCYELGTKCFAVYGFEYKPGFDDAYITWINDGKRSWTLRAPGMGADPQTEISARPIPFEPMYIIANLGFSLNFGHVDLDQLNFPATMSIDWIRVYQPKDAVNVGCDPKDFPTSQYIETYKNIYSNPNLTIWKDTQEPWPKNRLENDGKC
ncbi:beta-glucan synthesis-associated [Crassisporium funariophilum]|nr:beta-glucan synthesis-associated [Crassisporium funariophilum]